MRFLILGHPYLAAPLRAFGHHVLWASPDARADLRLEHPIFSARLLQKLGDFAPDVFLYLDDGNLPILIDPENLPCAALFYSIDTYCNPWHVCHARGYDLTLVAQKDFLPLFLAEGLAARWFPLFNIEPQAQGASERDIPVAFVGTLGHKNNPEREPFLRAFQKQAPLLIRSGDYRPIFARSRIALNQTAFSELNFRCFEAMACGCALLMEDCGNGLRDLFTPGENILPLYARGDAPGAAAIARQYLARPDELAAVALAGRELAAKSHGAAARARQLLDLCAPLLPAAAGRLKLAQKRRPYVRAGYGIIGAELTAPQLASQRDFYLRLATS